MASYMMSQESSYMESASDMQRKLTIKFQEYKATKDVNLKACCDTEQGCSYDTGNGVEKGDFRQWFQGSIDCPAGTKKVSKRFILLFVSLLTVNSSTHVY